MGQIRGRLNKKFSKEVKNIMNKEKEEALLVFELVATGKATYRTLAKETGKSYNYYYKLICKYKKEFGINGILSYYHWLKYTKEIEKIKSLYLDKLMSTPNIAKIYNVSERTVINWLTLENIPIRKSGTISKTNQKLFNTIDSEFAAYIIGLITADGSVNEKHSISITLTYSDKYLLEQINNRFFNGTGHFVEIHLEDNEKKRIVLQIHGKELCNSLEKHGIVPNKTYSLKQLSKQIPENLYHHYIRGLYDGDGVCSKCNNGIRIGYCAYNKEMVEDYKQFLLNTLSLNDNQLFNTGNCWQVSWSSYKDLINFYNYIYKDATIYLERKKEKIENFLKLIPR